MTPCEFKQHESHGERLLTCPDSLERTLQKTEQVMRTSGKWTNPLHGSSWQVFLLNDQQR
jgi:hypothetical protein